MRLLQGDFDQETVYGDDPVTVARRWQADGAELLHVVDLDATRAGHPMQMDLVESLAGVMPLQMGGGLRTAEDVQQAFERGVERVVLGTAALDRNLIMELARMYADRLVVALDTRDGMVAVQGWTELSGQTMLDVAHHLREVGVQRFLHTDVERDGTLTSPNYGSLAPLIALGTPVIASGGVSSIEHVRRLKSIGAEAAIIGRALYEGTVDLREAMAVAG